MKDLKFVKLLLKQNHSKIQIIDSRKGEERRVRKGE
jgi:hypothetical protein